MTFRATTWDGGDDDDQQNQNGNNEQHEDPGDYTHSDELLGKVDRDDSSEQAL